MLEQDYQEWMEQIRPGAALREQTVQRMAELGKSPKARPVRMKRAVTVAAAALLALCLTAGAAATVSLMTAKDVSRFYSDGNIEAAYMGENAVELEEEAVLGEYIVTLSGIAHDENHTYISLLYQHKDGSPCDIEKEDPYKIGVELLVSGLPPYVLNKSTMGIHGEGISVGDGVLYQTLTFPNMETFADRSIYLAVFDRVFSTDEYPVKSQADPSTNKIYANVDEVVKMNEDGSMEFLEGYPNAHAMFILPFDQSKADPERAQEYLDSLEAYQNWIAQTGPFAVDPATGEGYYGFNDFQELQDCWKNYCYLG